MGDKKRPPETSARWNEIRAKHLRSTLKLQRFMGAAAFVVMVAYCLAMLAMVLTTSGVERAVLSFPLAAGIGLMAWTWRRVFTHQGR